MGGTVYPHHRWMLGQGGDNFVITYSKHYYNFYNIIIYNGRTQLMKITFPYKYYQQIC